MCRFSFSQSTFSFLSFSHGCCVRIRRSISLACHPCDELLGALLMKVCRLFPHQPSPPAFQLNLEDFGDVMAQLCICYYAGKKKIVKIFFQNCLGALGVRLLFRLRALKISVNLCNISMETVQKKASVLLWEVSWSLPN